MQKRIFAIALLLAVLVAGCAQNPQNTAPANTAGNNATPALGANTNTGGTQLTTQNAIIQNGDTVQVNYRGTLSDGTEFDSSLKTGRTPLEFKVGAGQMIKGFDI
ncbi:MAG: FKBP-type peptidyl-prolyl cis-trans isomerase, partial [Candidatus Diapherotrites archaeon]|nr:FKBP-type peptidyl-prolyl cis-trans isomerase [Candidatus Diapherotrites archaeon]